MTFPTSFKETVPAPAAYHFGEQYSGVEFNAGRVFMNPHRTTPVIIPHVRTAAHQRRDLCQFLSRCAWLWLVLVVTLSLGTAFVYAMMSLSNRDAEKKGDARGQTNGSEVAAPQPIMSLEDYMNARREAGNESTEDKMEAMTKLGSIMKITSEPIRSHSPKFAPADTAFPPCFRECSSFLTPSVFSYCRNCSRDLSRADLCSPCPSFLSAQGLLLSHLDLIPQCVVSCSSQHLVVIQCRNLSTKICQ